MSNVRSDPRSSYRSRAWRWVIYLLIGLAIPVCYVAWKYQTTKDELFGFQPPEMALAQYTPNDVIGDLGGMKVRIPRHCAEYVEYDGDPRWGEKRKGPAPDRTFESRLSSFGIDARFPDMKCKENKEMREDYRRQWLEQDNPWVSIGINAGKIYPGVEAADRHAKSVVNSIDKPTEFWFENYERLPKLVFGLNAYVVTGVDPYSGKPARESVKTNDKFFQYSKAGTADTYISCGRTNVPGGVASCSMSYSVEPTAKVLVRVRFVRSRLSEWREIRQSVIDLLSSFDVCEGDSGRPSSPSSHTK